MLAFENGVRVLCVFVRTSSCPVSFMGVFWTMLCYTLDTFIHVPGCHTQHAHAEHVERAM